MARYHDGMVRRQIQLTEEQEAKLRRLAVSDGKSIAALIRDAVDGLLAEDERERERLRERAFAVIGKHRSGGRALGREHDRYLAEDFGR